MILLFIFFIVLLIYNTSAADKNKESFEVVYVPFTNFTHSNLKLSDKKSRDVRDYIY